MEFNSLDAQREAGEAYIASQRANGWVCLPNRYDDGGFSGATTNRPALTSLLADAEAGKIDIIVVYKIDRLSRSIGDFADLTRQFDKWNVSFVSVTQDINTATSSGRMMLNILVTFAQYEREVIAERIRDKFCASRKKGMWMGGAVPLGYRVQDRKLHIVPEEGQIVRRIFDRFIETQSPKLIAIELNEDGIKTKRDGIWNIPKIYCTLNNYTYAGKVSYKGEIFDGEHEAIVSQPVWDAAHDFLKANRPRADKSQKTENILLLRGIIFCGHCGGPMIPAVTKKNGRRYTYYRCMRDSKRATSLCPIRQIAAPAVEKVVCERIAAILQTPDVAVTLAGMNGLTPATVITAIDGEFWREMSRGELRRFVELMVAGIQIYIDKLEIEIRTEGIKSIMEEIEHEADGN
jgi:site-specific DNA recombinase